MMTDQDLNLYRFSPEHEPTDEMLAQVMKEVAEEARISNQQAAERYFSEMSRNVCAKKLKWESLIKCALHEY